MTREPIKENETALQLVVKLAEGNPGAMRVIKALLQRGEEGLTALLNLDDMNIRGSQLWVAYKDFVFTKAKLEKPRSEMNAGERECHEQAEWSALIDAARQRDTALVEAINRGTGYPRHYPHEAVTSGASFKP